MILRMSSGRLLIKTNKIGVIEVGLVLVEQALMILMIVDIEMVVSILVLT